MPLTFLTDHTSPRLRALDEQIVREWNVRYPDASVALSVVDHEELKANLLGHLTQRPPPDVLTWVAGNRERSLIDDGLMLDVRALWRRADIAGAFPARFRPETGRVTHHLPTSQYWWAMYYRPSLFASLRIPAPVETWEQLHAAAATLRSAGIAPIALGAKYHCPSAAWFDYLDMRINGPGFHRDLMRLRVPYTDPRVRNVFTFWQRMLDDGWFLGSPTGYDEQDAVDAVRLGTAGMTLIGAYVHDEYLPDGEPDIDFFPVPMIDPALDIGEDAPSDGYFVAGRSAEPAAALDFLAHLASREVQRLTVQALAVLPTRDDVDLSGAGPHVRRGSALLRRADLVLQFYDLDTPWELAEVGLRAIRSFLDEPDRAGALLHQVEDRRASLLRQGARTGRRASAHPIPPCQP